MTVDNPSTLRLHRHFSDRPPPRPELPGTEQGDPYVIEAELAALRQRIALLEAHLDQLRAAATHEEGVEPA